MIPLFDLAPTRRLAVVTYSLIAANVVAYLWELRARDGRIAHYAFYPCAVSGPCAAAVRDHLPWAAGALASMFLHASWWHLGGNMLFLFIFGNNVEDVMGRARFLVFYLCSGLAAALAQAWVTLHYAGIHAASVPNVGASGAIAGVLGAYAVLLPHARVIALLGFIPLPFSALFFIGLWFVLQLWQAGFSATSPGTGGGVAFAAHVGGFLFGALTVRAFQVRPPLGLRR